METLKQQYLDAMGIRIWVPRGSDVVQQTPILEPALEREGPPLPTRPPKVKEPMKADDPSPVASENIAAPPNDSDEIAEQTVEFRLACLYIPEVAFISCDMSLSGPGELTPEQHKLMRNLLAALGVQLQDQNQWNVFSWPMLRNVKMDQGEQVAREAVNSFLAAQLEDANINFALLIGRDAEAYMLESIKPRLPVAAKVVAIGVSAQDMLEQPLVKRDVWTAIQIFRRLQDVD